MTATDDIILRLIRKISVVLDGNDWDMVVATLQESADNCFRCKNKGCEVCKMTRELADNIERQSNG